MPEANRPAFIIKGGTLRQDEGFETWNCWGHFSSFERAEQCLKENWVDIFPNCYGNTKRGIACIYKVPEGLWISREEVWYRISEDGADRRQKPSWIGSNTL